ncbi:MAG: glycosyltransferase family 92 protein [Verrucomicrobia bacterium]|nr:glycosyltransferase family 92 protein [Verrucomicrobiota bacterium]
MSTLGKWRPDSRESGRFFLLLFLFCSACWATPITPYQNNLETHRDGEIAICCIFQDEASWLKEWIEYHLLIGVEYFYLYNNLSKDSYLEVLAPYLEAGRVELYDFPHAPLCNYDQKTTYNHAIEMARGHNKWLAIIDVDEFLVPMAQDSLKECLKAYDDHAGLYVRQQLFGTSEVENLEPGELLIEKLLYKAPSDDPMNIWGKALIQPSSTLECETPHWCSFPPGTQTTSPSIDILRLHHYFVRTKHYLTHFKLDRIRRWNQNAFHVGSLLEYMPRANSVRDDTMLRFTTPLHQSCSNTSSFSTFSP